MRLKWILLTFLALWPSFVFCDGGVKVITNGSRQEKKIALTFDACPAHDAVVDWKVIQTLVQSKTPATLFLSGKWMSQYPDATLYLATLPQFELANHSYSHPHMTKLSNASLKTEFEKTQEILKGLTGTVATHFRPPYGEYDTHIVQVAQSLGLETVEYDLPSGDPDPTFTKDKLIHAVTSQTQNGSIIVMHMNGRGWHTAEALPEIIRRLAEKGFQFVTVSKLVGESHPTLQHKGYFYFLNHLPDNKSIL